MTRNDIPAHALLPTDFAAAYKLTRDQRRPSSIVVEVGRSQDVNSCSPENMASSLLCCGGRRRTHDPFSGQSSQLFSGVQCLRERGPRTSYATSTVQSLRSSTAEYRQTRIIQSEEMRANCRTTTIMPNMREFFVSTENFNFQDRTYVCFIPPSPPSDYRSSRTR